MELNFAKIAILKAASITRVLEVDRWIDLDTGQEVKLPLTWRSRPRVLETIELPQLVESEDISIYMRIYSNSECLVYIDDRPYHIYMRRLEEFPIPSSIRRIRIYVMGRDVDGLGRRLEEVRLDRVALVHRSRTIYRLALTLEALYDLWRSSGCEELRREIEDVIRKTLSIAYVESLDPVRIEIAAELMRSYDYFQWYNPRRTIDEIPRSAMMYAGCREPSFQDLVSRAREALRYLENEITRLVERYGKKGYIHAVASTHLDFLWLWGRDVFEKKLVGTLATLLLYTRRYPHVVASITSTHYLYELSRLCPQLFEEIRKCFEEDRCVSLGGFWTEFDANLIDGESLARQFLYGQRVLEKLVGKRARVAFLPDTFGFPPSLPQILVKSGIEMVVVRKLSWNETNRFPYKHFLWIGIDGTAIPTIFVDHISASLPVSARDIERVFRGVDRYIDRILYPYGYGDGGGGPSEEAIEKLEIYSKLPTLPRVVHGDLDTLINTVRNSIEVLPTWFGELYLENHRGVYSVGLKLKKLIRRCVRMLKALDALLVIAKLRGLNVNSYRDTARRLWLEVLAHQFHDVLASTLSHDALVDAAKALGKVYAETTTTIKNLLKLLEKELSQGIALVNPHPWRYRAVVELRLPPGYRCVEYDSRVLPCQVISEDSEGVKVLVEVELPPLGIAVLKPIEKSADLNSAVRVECDEDSCVLENEVLKIVVDRASGELVSVLDKETGREVLKRRSNRIIVCEDRARHWEGWNVDEDYTDRCFELSRAEDVSIGIVGPIRSCIRVVKRFRRSAIVQKICLDRGSRIVWFFTEMDWRERQHIVKAWFYPDVWSSEAWFETSFGAFARPRHRNTSWDRARFEVWTHRWVDVSEKSYGVALLALDSRGVSVDLEGIGLTILRSPISPSIQDVGRVEIVYALYPHRGDWRDARLQHLVREIDEMPIAIEIDGKGNRSTISVLEVENAVVESVKLCEDRDECVVLRLFEGYGDRARATIRFEDKDIKCFETDITESRWIETTCSFELRPFEVKTIAFELQRDG